MRSRTALDAEVRLFVYRYFVEEGRAPAKSDVAAALSLDSTTVTDTFERLAAGKALVLQAASGEVLMAEPFSAVPTPFSVESRRGRWWGNCVWDALGIPAMLGEDARIKTSCGDCNEALELIVENGRLLPAQGVVHFAVPARRWWEDVVFA